MRYVDELIDRLSTDEVGSSCLLEVAEALRLARTKTLVTVSERLNQEGVTEEEAGRLRAAVFEASRNNLDPARRFELLLMCLRDGDMRVREEVESEAARLAVAIREAGAALYQAIVSLEDAGIDVYPPEITGSGSNRYQDNVEAAMAYLSKRGLFGERMKAHHDHLAASPKKRERR